MARRGWLPHGRPLLYAALEAPLGALADGHLGLESGVQPLFLCYLYVYDRYG